MNSGRLDSSGVNYNDGYFSYRQDNGKICFSGDE